MSSLSIAFLSHLASPGAPTGAEHSLRLLAEGMLRRGHRVRVTTPAPWTLSPALRLAGAEVKEIPVRMAWRLGYDPSVGRDLLRLLRFALPDAGARQLTGWLDRHAPDVAHVNCLPHLRGAAACRRSGRPFIWHLREIPPPGRLRAWYGRRMRASGAHFVAVSEAVADWAREEGVAVDVIPNGVPAMSGPAEPAAARRELGLPEEGCLVGLFGQLVPHKGARDFLAAADRAVRVEPGLRFAVAGAGPDDFVAELRRRIAGSAHRERLHLLPPQPDGRQLIAAADVVCLATTTPDPFPRSVLEASGAGRPVVGYASGGAPEMIESGRSGLLVDVGHVDGLADAFVALARDPERRRAMGRAGSERVRREFGLERHLDRMEALFLELARSS